MLKVTIPYSIFNDQLRLIELGIIQNMTIDNFYNYIEEVEMYSFNFNKEDGPVVKRVLSRMFKGNEELILYDLH